MPQPPLITLLSSFFMLVSIAIFLTAVIMGYTGSNAHTVITVMAYGFIPLITFFIIRRISRSQ